MTRISHSTLARCALGLAALALAGTAAAQYKIVHADGSVTYADRPPAVAGGARVTQLGRSGAAATSEPTLPPPLRQAAQRYPVTLYSAPDCAPCEAARRLLQRRGIPYRERRVAGADDAQALEGIVGARTVPALTIGAQALRGYAEAEWDAYLDAAGYPRTSLLPPGWPAPVPTPLVAERVPAEPAPAPAAVEPPAEQANAPAPSGLRF